MNEHEIVQVNGFDAVVIDGIPRVLAKLPPDPTKRALFSEVPVGGVDLAQWQEIDRRTQFGDDFLIDQKSHGSCVGFSSVAALMKCRVLAGMKFQRLSGAFTYSKVNGGRDNGAIIHDSISALQQYGTCLEATVPWDKIYPQQQPASAPQEATRFKLLESYVVNSWNDLISALQLGFIVEAAVMVGNTFTRLDSNGIAGFDAGPGNHAIHLDGCKKINGQWVADLANSWGASFGQRGRCYYTQRHFEGVEQDSYADRAATDDPQDPNSPPTVKV